MEMDLCLFQKSFCLLFIIHHVKDLRFTNEDIANFTRYEVRVGDDIHFDCDAEGEPPPFVKWQKYGKPLEEVCYRYEGLSHYKSLHLQLTHALLPDSGYYSCVVSNGGNETLTRSFELDVLEKKDPSKPKIKGFLPQNLTIVAGKPVRLQCFAEAHFNDTPPFIKIVRYGKVSIPTNSTKAVNLTEKLNEEINRVIKRRNFIPYLNRNYEIKRDGNSIGILETMKLDRSIAVEYAMERVELGDDAVYSCIAFNEVGYSKETTYLHVIPPPKPSIYELALAYAAKFGDDNEHKHPDIPLSATVGLPVVVMIILTIGYIWWRENIRSRTREERLSLIKIKKLRELDDFSSLDHMEKFSSRMETKRSSFLSDAVHDHTQDHIDCNNDHDEHDRLLGNGHTLALPIECNNKDASHKSPEMIALHEMGTATLETPVTGRSSAFDSHSELEWEPVDLKLNIPMKGTLSQILDSSA